jgi:hypothetical protein
MRLRVVTLFLSCSALAALWACALNPQPLPPDGYDAAADAIVATKPEAGGGEDGSATDGGPPFGEDAGIDANDASDSGDASDASDAADDARDDDASDAGGDG